MTCIVGCIDGEKVYIGGDSGASNGWQKYPRKDSKVFRRGDFLIGFTTSYRMGQLLRFNLNVPAHPEGLDSYEYIVTYFIEAVRECLKVGGFASKINENETGGQFLVGYKGRLFKVDTDYQVQELTVPFDACGCGEQFAIAAMDALSEYKMPPDERIYLSLKIAERWSNGVAGPFTVESL